MVSEEAHVKSMYQVESQKHSVRGQPLMIWEGAPEKKSKMDLFFPSERLFQFFFLEKGFEIFFPGFPPAPPQIINGRPLKCPESTAAT